MSLAPRAYERSPAEKPAALEPAATICEIGVIRGKSRFNHGPAH